MFKKLLTMLAFVSLLVVLPGCPSFTSHQTAEVLDKDEIEWGQSFSTLVIPYTSTDIDGNKTEETLTLPTFQETLFRFGFNESMDIGIKVTNFFWFEGDVKFQLMKSGDDTNNFSLAISPSVTYSALLQKYGLSVIASKRMSGKSVLYGSLKYNYFAGLDSSNDNMKGFGEGSYFSASAGFSFEGKKWWLRPEVNLVMNNDFEVAFYSPAIGFGFKF